MASGKGLKRKSGRRAPSSSPSSPDLRRTRSTLEASADPDAIRGLCASMSQLIQSDISKGSNGFVGFQVGKNGTPGGRIRAERREPCFLTALRQCFSTFLSPSSTTTLPISLFHIIMLKQALLAVALANLATACTSPNYGQCGGVSTSLRYLTVPAF